MVIIAEQEQIQEYFNSPALGQSTLKKLLGNLSAYHKEVDSSASHFVLGSAVDCILTAPEDEFEKQYYVSKVDKKPSDTIVEILNLVHQRVLEDYQEYLSVAVIPTEGKEEDWGWENLESNEVTDIIVDVVPISSLVEFAGNLINWETYLLDAALQVDWQRTWGDAAKIKNLVTDKTQEYFMDLCQSYGKTIIDTTQETTIWNIVRSFRNNPRTSRFFNREAFEENPLVEVYYQFPIYFEHKGVQCKALLDMLIVEKSVDTFVEGVDVAPYIVSITPIDFKTMFEDTYNFMSSLKLRRYDIQAAWYTLAVHKCFNISENSDIVKPFMFVVESTSFQGKPLAFQLSEEVLKIGRYGRESVKLVDTNLFSPDEAPQTTLQRKVPGFEELMDNFIFYETNGWHEEKTLQMYGVSPIILNWEGIVEL